MSFSDLTFLFYFLPLFFAVYYLVPFRCKNAVLVLGSAACYLLGAGMRDALLLSAVLLLHYFLARLMVGRSPRMRKGLLAAALSADLFCLVYFKYAAFFLENWGKLTGQSFPLIKLVLPLGVSFYLFQSAGYLIDVCRGAAAEKNLVDYAAFTIAFPQLTMGPILRYDEWRGALKERTLSREDAFLGFELFAVGLCFKVLLADQLAPLWASLERIGYGYLSTPLAWLGAASYSLQLYFDFSGYSLMAMGLGQMLGLPVPRNFDLPYTARSVSEFYRRWHITLGTWFRDYLYIPLGGSRRGSARTALALTVVWFFTGLWHGASWNFVVWGLFYGVILITEKYFTGKILAKLPGAVQTLYTMILVMLGWVLFFSPTLGSALTWIGNMFGQGATGFMDSQALYLIMRNWLFWVAGIIGSTPFMHLLGKRLVFNEERPHTVLAGCLMAGLFVLCVAYLVTESYNPFLYFRF